MRVSQNKLRQIRLIYDAFGFADASVFFELGKTQVLCGVTLQQGVPKFLQGSNSGWLTAEYAMLPTSTKSRAPRAVSSSPSFKRSRSVEISRLIGRCLRSVTLLDEINGFTIYVDCDVLQADGGTRVSCITAASYALQQAQERWIQAGIIKNRILKELIAAVSVGIVDDEVVLDLDQEQDARAKADFNFVFTETGRIVEIQGTAEKDPISHDNFMMLYQVAVEGVKNVFASCAKFFPTEDGRPKPLSFKDLQQKKDTALLSTGVLPSYKNE